MSEDMQSLDNPKISLNELEDDPRLVRQRKRSELYDQGYDPYGHAFTVTAHTSELEEKYADLANGESTEDEYIVAGRIMAIRNQGKIAFIVIKDETGELQLFTRINTLGEEAFEFVKNLDMGDWIGATGTILRTKRGQLSLLPNKVELLSKALRPLPEKFHGLSDKETRYRQRYVDLIVNDDVREVFQKRFKILSAIRHKMESLGFLEVETPMIHMIVGGANAKPFISHYNALNQDVYMRIAPELFLKRLLVGGFERVFEINRCFRNEGMDLRHNPEFTTIEAYQAFSDLEGMKELAQAIVLAANDAINPSRQISYQGQEIDLGAKWASRPMAELVSEVVNQTINFDTEIEVFQKLMDEHGLSYKDDWKAGKFIAELFDELVEPTLINPTFVTDYPLEVSPLAKKDPDDPRKTLRFELFICGREYANAFTELNDPVDQKERFAAQMKAKASGDDEAMDFDTDYIRALEYGMPPAGGIGLGIDRLVMLLTDQASIRDVLLFPQMKPEEDKSLQE
ncbi:MAG: lysine--tRNA ligase [Coriobacteriia bacterium]|nr:lysine--tRNA ligase [Coriobacteriia bacterium]